MRLNCHAMHLAASAMESGASAMELGAPAMKWSFMDLAAVQVALPVASHSSSEDKKSAKLIFNKKE